MEVKQRIEQTASELFLKLGLRSVSIDDICSEIHISKKTFYNYFATKEALIEALLLVQRTRNVDAQNKACAGNAIDHVLSEISRVRKGAADKYVNFFFDLKKYYPEILAKHETEMHAHALESAKRGLQVGIEQGLFRSDMNVDAMAVLFQSRVTSLMSDLHENTSMNTAQILEFITETYLRLIASEKGWEYYQQNKNKIR